MPKLARRTSSKLGALGSIRSFVSVVKEVNFDEVRANAEMPPRLLVLAPSEDDARALGDLIAGTTDSPYVVTAAFDDMPKKGGAYDGVVVFDPTDPKRSGRVASTLRATDLGLPVVAFTSLDVSDTAAAERVRVDLLTRNTDRAPAFGRHLPAFRAAAVEALIDESARANAQFALVSNVPSVIPIIGSFAAAGADMVVLTKNQVMMIYKIAATHDRDLRDQWRIIREVSPVVGAGFLWRTVAREAASFLPLLIGTLPKVAVAYIGTVVAGRGADFFYRFGKKPTREQMRVIYRQAAEAAKQIPKSLPGRSSTDDAA